MTVIYPEVFKKIRKKSRELDVVPDGARDLAILRLIMRKVRRGSMRLKGVSFHSSSRGVVDRAVIEVVSTE